MPHITVKLWPGSSEETKEKLAAQIVEDAMELINLGEDSFSVSIEEVAPEDWKEQVYLPEIVEKKEYLYKQPGYKM